MPGITDKDKKNSLFSGERISHDDSMMAFSFSSPCSSWFSNFDISLSIKWIKLSMAWLNGNSFRGILLQNSLMAKGICPQNFATFLESPSQLSANQFFTSFWEKTWSNDPILTDLCPRGFNILDSINSLVPTKILTLSQVVKICIITLKKRLFFNKLSALSRIK